MIIRLDQDYMHVHTGSVDTAGTWMSNPFFDDEGMDDTRDKEVIFKELIDKREMVAVVEVEDENGDYFWEEDE